MTPLLLLAFVMVHPLAVVGAIALGLLCFGTLLVPIGAFTQDAVNKLLAGDFNPIAVSGAVNPHVAAKYIITKAGVAALTLAAPTVGLEDGLLIEIISNTANAHTITTVALLRTGTANTNVLTYAAQIGASVILQAYQGKWFLSSATAVTATS